MLLLRRGGTCRLRTIELIVVHELIEGCPQLLQVMKIVRTPHYVSSAAKSSRELAAKAASSLLGLLLSGLAAK